MWVRFVILTILNQVCRTLRLWRGKDLNQWSLPWFRNLYFFFVSSNVNMNLMTNPLIWPYQLFMALKWLSLFNHWMSSAICRKQIWCMIFFISHEIHTWSLPNLNWSFLFFIMFNDCSWHTQFFFFFCVSSRLNKNRCIIHKN